MPLPLLAIKGAKIAAKAAIKAKGGPKSNLGKTLINKGSVGKIAGLAGKILPGKAGMIAKSIGNIFNDDCWWQAYTSGGMTTNLPLRAATRPVLRGGVQAGQANRAILRPLLMEVISSQEQSTDPSISRRSVIRIPLEFLTAFVLPEVRHVLNAVPLQDNVDYAESLQASCTLIAIKYTLEKLRYLIQHQVPNIPAVLMVRPISAPKNFAQMEALIRRVEATMSARIRIPATMMEYLAWRFGRTYKSNPSSKAAWVMYNPLPLDVQYEAWLNLVEQCESQLTLYSQATADLYNAYKTHKQSVEFAPGTEIAYDLKEFNLRTNIDLGSNSRADFTPLAPVVIDSDLSNPETTTSSTISSNVPLSLTEFIGGGSFSLFPVDDISVTVFFPAGYAAQMNNISDAGQATLAPTGVTAIDLCWGNVLMQAAKGQYGPLLYDVNTNAASTTTGAPVYIGQNPNNPARIRNYHRDFVIYGNGNPLILGTWSATGFYRSFWGTDMALNAGAYMSISMAAGAQPTYFNPNYSAPSNLNPPGNWIGFFSASSSDSLQIDQNGVRIGFGSPAVGGTYGRADATSIISWYVCTILAKSLDLYNCDLALPFLPWINVVNPSLPTQQAGYRAETIDSTNISVDTGLMPGEVLYTTQRMAFANLFYPHRKTNAHERKDDERALNRAVDDLHITGKMAVT